ncbi:MAG: hypothetical protein WCT33_00710 [Patescibacteria group bacterium]
MVLVQVSQILARIPDGTTRISLLGRHSLSVQDGPNETRTLSADGIQLCNEVSGFYTQLVHELEVLTSSSEAAFYCSDMARSFATIQEIFHPDSIYQDDRLNLLASLKKIDGGAWFKEQKDAGCSEREIISNFIVLTDPSVGADQPFELNARNYLHWAAEPSGPRLRVAFAHEVACTMAAYPYFFFGEQWPGLKECESYMFCMNDWGHILRMIKVTPPATQ